MKKLFAFAIALGLALAMPGPVSAKPGTTKIVITGGQLTRPLIVTDPEVLKHFNVWHGYLSRHVSAAPAGSPQPYEVHFYVKFSDNDVRMAFVSYYHPKVSGEQGYIYVPRRGERWHELNAKTGMGPGWFRASREWEALIQPLIAAAETAQRR